MVLRNIVKIDEEKCDGCGQCVNACAEGAIEIIDGKAKLVSEVYCDGLGACIGHCPQDAITIEKQEAAQFDEEATKAHLAKEQSQQKQTDFVCPGIKTAKLREKDKPAASTCVERRRGKPVESGAVEVRSQLSHWPVQLKLVSPSAECYPSR